MSSLTPSIKAAELPALTSLRGIAAVLVMTHHFMFVLLGGIAAFMPSRFFLKSYLWVDLFFILSGFVLAYVYHQRFNQGISQGEYRHFMLARLARIYPLHIFTLAFLVLFELLQLALLHAMVPNASNLTPPFTGSETWLSVVSNLLLLQTLHWDAYWNQPAWSISAEWLTYWCVPFFIYYLPRLGDVAKGGIVAGVMLCLCVIEGYFGDLGLAFAGWPMLVRCSGEAILGVLAFDCYQRQRFSRLNAGATVPLLALTFLLLALPLPAVFSVAGFVLLILAAARITTEHRHLLNTPLLVYLGRISFALYLVHWLVLELLRTGSAWFTGAALKSYLSLGQQFGVLLGATLVSLLLAAWLYRYVETPWRHRVLAAGKSRRSLPPNHRETR